MFRFNRDIRFNVSLMEHTKSHVESSFLSGDVYRRRRKVLFS